MMFFKKNCTTVTFSSASIAVATTLVLCLSGCGYRVTLNEAQVLYEPPSLFTQYRLADKSLQRCVDLTITEENITAAEQLRTLICTYNDITSLVGLEQFPQLTQINLSNNAIGDPSPLARLPQLRLLLLNDNRLQTVAPLTKLTQLQRLELSGNEQLDCRELTEFKNTESLLAPAHCSTNSSE